MKKTFPVFAIVLLVILSGCASRKSPPAPSEPGEQLAPEVSTTLPDNALPPTTDSTDSTVGQTPSAVTLEDNGKTFNFHVGDAFLLNLGNEVYDWDVTIDNQNVIALKVGVTVIKGAQGLFDALSSGTAMLTAVGDPLCRKSAPPCGMPTILFKVTLIVQ